MRTAVARSFTGSSTHQGAISAKAFGAAMTILQAGRLHRCKMRLPLSFAEADCALIAGLICHAADEVTP